MVVFLYLSSKFMGIKLMKTVVKKVSGSEENVPLDKPSQLLVQNHFLLQTRAEPGSIALDWAHLRLGGGGRSRGKRVKASIYPG